MRPIIICLAVLIALTGVQCSKVTESSPKQVDLSAAKQKVADSSNKFGLTLFQELVSSIDPDSNIYFSPLSVSYALGMTFNGAAGETREAMAATLEYGDLTTDQINASYKSLMEILPQVDPIVSFNIANAIWYRMYPHKEIVPEFIDICQTYFGAPVEEIDFQAPGTADTINQWAIDNTNGKIEEIIKAPISPDLAMLLANAVYFQGIWSDPFDTADTRIAPFYPKPGEQVDCQMMYKDTLMNYYQNDLFQAVDLPYGDGSFSMTILLPVYGKSIDDLIAELNEDNWTHWLDSLSETDVHLSLPKFQFAFGDTLNNELIAMGMERAFQQIDGGFGNMFVDGIGWISCVRHKCFIRLDENGTEAAAVTVVEMYDAAFPNSMNVSRPFLSIIHEHELGTILFMGKIANPVWED